MCRGLGVKLIWFVCNVNSPDNRQQHACHLSGWWITKTTSIKRKFTNKIIIFVLWERESLLPAFELLGPKCEEEEEKPLLKIKWKAHKVQVLRTHSSDRWITNFDIRYSKANGDEAWRSAPYMHQTSHEMKSAHDFGTCFTFNDDYF